MPRRDPEKFVLEVTQRIAATRRAAGLTLEAAAHRYGLALKNWQRIEAGQNLTLHTLARVANALGVSPESLLVAADLHPNPPAAKRRTKARPTKVKKNPAPKKKKRPVRGRRS